MSLPPGVTIQPAHSGVVGSKLQDLFPHLDIAHFLPMLARCAAAGEDVIGTELPFRDKLIDVVLHPVREREGPVRRILNFVQDVTHGHGAQFVVSLPVAVS